MISRPVTAFRLPMNRTAQSARVDPGDDVSARSVQIRRILIIVLTLNLAVAAVKLGYGLFTSSVSMTADGVHSLLDAFANVVGLIGIAVASRPPDREHHFGHERYETLASMAIGAVMAVGVVEIVRSAISSWQSGSVPEVTALSFAVMLASMAVNASLTMWERNAATSLHSELLAADSRHTRSDVLLAAVIASLIAERLGIRGADAVISLVVAAMIAWAAWSILHEASLVLTDAATDVDPPALLAAIVGAPGVETAHNPPGPQVRWP